jgi:hypothetical protein
MRRTYSNPDPHGAKIEEDVKVFHEREEVKGKVEEVKGEVLGEKVKGEVLREEVKGKAVGEEVKEGRGARKRGQGREMC